MHWVVGHACIFLAVFGMLFLLSAPSGMTLMPKKQAVTKRKTSVKRKNEKEVFSKISDKCEVPELHVPVDKISSAFLASYPGSGTKLQWELVEAMTGLVTTDDTFSNGHHNVIAIKTHYPCPAGREFPGAEEVFKSIIFIRHPMDALAAYHDIIYTGEKGLSVDNPIRAPPEEWINWRDLAFARELETWRKHFAYWIERYSSLNRVIVPYEQLVSRKYGPDLVLQIAAFLKSGNNAIETVDTQDLPCIWQKVLQKVLHGGGSAAGNNDRNDVRRRLLQQEEDQGRRRLGASLPLLGEREFSRPFSESQRKEVVIVLTQLLELHREDRVLAPLLVDYIDQVAMLHEAEEQRSRGLTNR